ncbi:hypothetical protein BGZ49_010213, partial [Haplosporangium sp. Z 27]
ILSRARQGGVTIPTPEERLVILQKSLPPANSSSTSVAVNPAGKSDSPANSS